MRSEVRPHDNSFKGTALRLRLRAEGVFYDPLALNRPDPDADAEDRFVAVGRGITGAVLVVVYTIRGEDIRLISARRATRQEIKEYES